MIAKLLKQGYQYQKHTKIVSEYDQEIPQSQTADNPVAPRVNHHETPGNVGLKTLLQQGILQPVFYDE